MRKIPGRNSPAVILLAALLWGCDSSSSTEPEDEGPTQNPGVLNVLPIPHSFTDIDTEIILAFDEALVLDSVQPPVLQVFGRWSGVAEGELVLSPDSMQLRFDPEAPFAAGERVTVTLAAGIKGRDSGKTRVGYAWNFWTRSAPGSMELSAGEQIPVRRPDEGWIRSSGGYAGDFDGDGFSDLMVPNQRSSDVRVFLNDGSGSYEGPTVYPIPNGSVPSASEGADFNGDGIVDFAVGNSGNDLVSVFLGTGSGQFVHDANYKAGRGIGALCVLDIDGDGLTDIFTANREADGAGSVTGLRNDDGINFERTLLFTVAGSGETACATADANGDGIMDVFVGSFESGNVALLVGDGFGRYAVGATINASEGPWTLAAGDVDGDGDPDVVSANLTRSSFSVIFGDGRGGFAGSRNYPVGDTPVAIHLGDLDGDQDLDVVTSNFGSADWTVYENMGAGVFGNPRTLDAGTAGSHALLHDRDNDGDLDMTGIDERDDLVFLFING